MRRFISAVFAALSLFSLSACGIPEIPYDRDAAKNIKSVGIITPRFPADPTVHLASSPGQSFGLVGALVDAGIQASRESRFKSAMQGQNFQAEDLFLASLTASLKAVGYETSTVTLKHDQNDFVAVYPKDRLPQVDAFLDVVVSSYGYAAAGVMGDTPYRPWMTLKIRMVEAKNSAVLMQNTVLYNPIGGPRGKTISIAPNPAFQFSSSDILVSDAPRAVEGLRNALDQTAQTIGQLLK